MSSARSRGSGLRRLVLGGAVAVSSFSLSGCWAAVAGAGAYVLHNDTQNQNKDVCAIIGKVKLKPPAPAPAPAAVVVAPLTPPAISDEMLLAVVTACFDPTDFRGNQNGEDEGMSEAKAGLPPRKPLDTIPRRSSSLDLFPDSPQTQHLDPSDSDHHANRFDP